MLDDAKWKKHVLEERVWCGHHQLSCEEERVLQLVLFVCACKRKCGGGGDTPAIHTEYLRGMGLERGRGAEGDLDRTVTRGPCSSLFRSSICSLGATFLVPMVRSSYAHTVRPKPYSPGVGILPFSTAGGSRRSQHLRSPSCAVSLVGDS